MRRIFGRKEREMPIPVAELSKVLVCGRVLVGIVGSNPAGGVNISVVSVACCQVEVCASGLSFVQRSPIKNGVSERSHETSMLRRPWPNRGSCAHEKLEEK